MLILKYTNKKRIDYGRPARCCISFLSEQPRGAFFISQWSEVISKRQAIRSATWEIGDKNVLEEKYIGVNKDSQ